MTVDRTGVQHYSEDATSLGPAVTVNVVEGACADGSAADGDALDAAYLDDSPGFSAPDSSVTTPRPCGADFKKAAHRKQSTERARAALANGAVTAGGETPTTQREAVDALADALAGFPAAVETLDGLTFCAANLSHLAEARHLDVTNGERIQTKAVAAAIVFFAWYWHRRHPVGGELAWLSASI